MEEFLATGERDVDEVLAVARRNGLASYESSLDFGCGVGRLTRALAARFGRAVGVDISEGMIDRARRINGDLTNVAFIREENPDLPQLGTASFDLVLSLYVLQHLPSEQLIRQTLVSLARLVRPGGTVVFQLPDRIPLRHRLQARPRTYRLLRSIGLGEAFLQSRLGLHPIRMRGLAPANVETTLGRAGVRITEVVRTPMYGTRMESVLYVATPVTS